MLDDYDDFIKAMEKAPVSGIRINEKKPGAKEAVLDKFGELKPVEWCGAGFYADKSVINGKHPYHHAGLFYFQEPSAMTAAEAVRIEPDDKILDLCAAPGGKSTHAGAKLGRGGLLVANDISAKRSAVLAENLERFGINAVVLAEFPERLEDRLGGFFDKIIVDAPCSGEGMFRKEERAAIDWSIAHTESCAVRQSAILRSAAKMLAPGGYIIYSTCTFAPCENEGVISRFLNENPDFELVHMPALDMLTPGAAEYTEDGRKELSECRRVFPHRNGGEGHFAACLHFNGGSPERVKIPENAADAENAGGAVRFYREFEEKYLTVRLDGGFELFGNNLYLCDKRIGSLDRIKVIRPGLHLGEIVTSARGRTRFEPSYALAHYLEMSDIKTVVSYECDGEEIAAYLSGGEIRDDNAPDGWCAVCADGFVLGWGKASGGVVKNKYPKKLREF